MDIVFEGKKDFEAFYKACDFLKDRGFSVGSMQRDDPIGIRYGNWDIAKWRNLAEDDISKLDGTITGNKREGPVTVSITNADVLSHIGEGSQEVTDKQSAAAASLESKPKPGYSTFTYNGKPNGELRLESKPKPGYTTFTYNGKPRNVYELGSSDKHVAGVEVTAMPTEEKEAFLNLVAEFNEALAPYIKSYYRRFDRQRIQ